MPHREDLAKAGFTSSSTWLKGRTLPTQLHSATPLVAAQGQEPPENNRSVKFCRAELFIIVEDTHHCANYINCCPLWGQVGGLTTPSNVGNDAWACLYAENIWLFFFLNSFLWWPKTVIIGWIGWKLVALPCRGKVKPMNFALLQTLYWKQGRQDEGFWSICCNFLLAQEQVLFPSVCLREPGQLLGTRELAGRGDRLRTRNSQRDTLNANAITPLTRTLIFLAPRWNWVCSHRVLQDTRKSVVWHSPVLKDECLRSQLPYLLSWSFQG